MVRLGQMQRFVALGLCALLVAGCGDDPSPPRSSESPSPESTATPEPAAPDTAASDTTTSGREAPGESPSDDTTAATEMPAPDTTRQTALAADQKNRIGPTLQRLMRGDRRVERRVEPVGQRDGAPVYSVTIECDRPSALRAAGLPLTSVQGDVITARLTLDQIRVAATVEAVQIIRADTPVRPHSMSPSSRQDPSANAASDSPSERRW